jgi:hypothetical protein
MVHMSALRYNKNHYPYQPECGDVMGIEPFVQIQTAKSAATILTASTSSFDSSSTNAISMTQRSHIKRCGFETVHRDVIYIIRYAKYLAANYGMAYHLSKQYDHAFTTSYETNKLSLLASLKSLQHYIEGLSSLDELLMFQDKPSFVNMWSDTSVALFIITQDVPSVRTKDIKRFDDEYHEQDLMERSYTAADCLTGLFRLFSRHFCSRYYMVFRDNHQSTSTSDILCSDYSIIQALHLLHDIILRENMNKTRALMTHLDVLFSLKCISFVKEMCLAIAFQARISENVHDTIGTDMIAWIVPIILEQLDSTDTFDRRASLVGLLRAIVQLNANQVNDILQDLLTDQEYNQFLRKLFKNLSSENLRLVIDSLYMVVWISLIKTPNDVIFNAASTTTVPHTMFLQKPTGNQTGLASSRSSKSSFSSGSSGSTLSNSLNLSIDTMIPAENYHHGGNGVVINHIDSKYQGASRVLFSKQNLRSTFQLILNLVSKGGDSYVLQASCDLLQLLLSQCPEMTSQWLEACSLDQLQASLMDIMNLISVADDLMDVRALLSLIVLCFDHGIIRKHVLLLAQKHMDMIAGVFVRCLSEDDACLSRLMDRLLHVFSNQAYESTTTEESSIGKTLLKTILELTVTHCMERIQLSLIQVRKLLDVDSYSDPLLQAMKANEQKNHDYSLKGQKEKHDGDDDHHHATNHNFDQNHDGEEETKEEYEVFDHTLCMIHVCQHLIKKGSSEVTTHLVSILTTKWTTSTLSHDLATLLEPQITMSTIQLSHHISSIHFRYGFIGTLSAYYYYSTLFRCSHSIYALQIV